MYENQMSADKASGYAGNAGMAENPIMSLMRDYVQAKEQFDAACHSFVQCGNSKAEAEKRLLALSEKVTQTVQQGVYDPTAPQPAMPKTAMGGQTVARY